MANLNTTQAIAFLKSHDCIEAAYVNAEGLCAVAWTRVAPSNEAVRFVEPDDVWFEETTVFPLDASGTVSRDELRDYLGY